MRASVLVAVVCALSLGACKKQPGQQAQPVAPPATQAATTALPAAAKAPVIDTIHGVPIADDYRWLEESKDAKVSAWSDAQNAHARAILDSLPGVELLRERITDLMMRRPASFGYVIWRQGRFFALQSDPARKQQPSLVVLESLEPDAKPRLLLDLMALDPSGSTAIDWYVPSIDGSKVAISISERGSEAGTLHVYDVATAKETGEVIPRVQNGTAGGGLSWNADGSGFYYTRYPREGERPKEELAFWQQLYFHKLGTPEATDLYSLGKELPRIAEITLGSSEDGKHHLALVANGDGGDHTLWLHLSGGSWLQVAKYEDGITSARFGRDGALWLLTNKNAPRYRVLRLPLETPQLAKAKVVIDQLEGVIEQVVPMKNRLYVVEMLGGPTRLRQFDLSGKELKAQVPAPPVSTNTVGQRLEGDDILFFSSSYTEPSAAYRYEAKTGAMRPTIVRTTPLADFRDAEVVTEHATSKDGTKVPMYILQRRGTKRDGNNPALLTGYGGYGISTRPYYNDLRHVYLEQGVVLVSTALRGGSEFGEAWHKAGSLTNKQNVFDDFIACAQRLIELGYTSPQRLAIEGGSNGGLLMGAALTQRPDLFRAIVSHVGIYDMLRVELSSNGAFNVTEFGTVKDPEQFKALLAYSPYHHVKEGVPHGAVLFLTGANDPRVDPMQSRKMVARLQAAGAGPSPRPVLLRTSSNTGHGMGSPVRERISQQVDTHAFVLHELGVKVKPPEGAVHGG